MSLNQWKDAKDAKGRVYYYNIKTGKSQWEKPQELLTEKELLLQKHGWKVTKTTDGKVYYYHVQSGETRWDEPRLEIERNVRTEVEDTAKVDETAEAAPKESPESKMHSTDTEVSKSLLNVSKILNSPKKSKEEAEREFMQMLQENQVDSTWSFSKIISELGAKDPRYWMVDDDPLWKQEIFEKYLTTRTEDQLLQERTETKKFKEAFVQMLKGKTHIRYYTRWSTARRLIANEPIYKHSVVKEVVKRETFEDYIKQLKDTNDESNMALKSQALNELREYLQNILSNQDNQTKFSEDLPIISWQYLSNNFLFEKNKRYMANKHFKILTREDVLSVYVEILENKEKEMNGKWKALKESCYTKDRIARDNFKLLLRDRSINIRADSHWKDIYPRFKNNDQFLRMLGTDGSTALDLFLDYVEELKITIGAHRSIAQTLLIDKKFQWESDDASNRAGIRRLLEVDPNLKNVDEKDMELIIDQLLFMRKETIRQQAEMQQTIWEQKKRMFKHMLHRYYGNTKVKPTWDIAHVQIKETLEFKELCSKDTLVKKLYEEFLAECVSAASSYNTTVPKNSKKRPLTPTVELDY